MMLKWAAWVSVAILACDGLTVERRPQIIGVRKHGSPRPGDDRPIVSAPVPDAEVNERSWTAAPEEHPISQTIEPAAKALLCKTGELAGDGKKGTLDILSYNVQALPIMSGNGPRLDAIGQKIAGTPDIDVVGLQELFDVFSSEPRRAVTAQLSPIFPFYSPSTHSSSGDGHGESSGIALFSRLPWLPLKHPSGIDQRHIFPVVDEDHWFFYHPHLKMKENNQKFIFEPFRYATSADALANKGLLVAAIDITKKFSSSAVDSTSKSEFAPLLDSIAESGYKDRQIIFLFVTHAQSDNTVQDAIEVRRKQLHDIKDFIAATVAANTGPGSFYENSDFGAILLGDINEDTYWTERKTVEPFVRTLGNPTDVFAMANSGSQDCDSPPCHPICDDIATRAANDESKRSFASMAAASPGAGSWVEKCGYSCCLKKSSDKFITTFEGSPERLDYFLFYDVSSTVKGRLSLGKATKAQVLSSDDWLLSDHLAIRTSLELTVGGTRTC